MSGLSRRQFNGSMLGLSAAAAAGALAGPARAAAPQFVLKLSTNVSDTHPQAIRAREMARRVLDDTAGRVQIQLFPNNQLGGDTDVLSQLRSGAVDFMLVSPLILGALVPAAPISDVGFAFRGYDQVWPAMDGALGAYVRDQISSRSTLFAFEQIWDNGYRHVTLDNGAIHVPDDLRGKKMRVMQSAMSTSIFRALGAATVPINWSETYSALQTHVVDGQENPLVILTTSKIYEVQKTCSLTQHIWDGFWFAGNKANFARLPSDLQQVVRKRVNEAALLARADLAGMNKSLVAELEAHGMKFNTVDLSKFQDKLRAEGYYAQWRQKFGEEPWALLQKYAGTLA
jgi:TRAP-type transport system periplasmic protein